MAREFDGPLSGEDLVWLRSRYTEAYVQRQIDVHGVSDDEGGVEAAEKAALQEREAAEAQSQADADAAAREADKEAAAAQRQAEEDLIGEDEGYDVLGATEPEVKKWAESASDEEKAAALSTEQARTDREPRKGVVSLLS